MTGTATGLAERLAQRDDDRQADPNARPQTIGQWLEHPRLRQAIADALPKHLTPERFLRLSSTVIKNDPALLACTTDSLLAAIVKASQLGLEPGPLGHCYFLPFKDNRAKTTAVQFVMGYKGIIELGRRSGLMTDIQARAVKAADHFDYAYGLQPKLEHIPNVDTAERGDTTKFWGLVNYPNGGYYFYVAGLAEIGEHRARSSSPNSPAWKNDFDAMGCKTIIRIMDPYIPKSSEYAEASQIDGAVISGFDSDGASFIDVDARDSADDGAPAGDDPTATDEPCEVCGAVGFDECDAEKHLAHVEAAVKAKGDQGTLT